MNRAKRPAHPVEPSHAAADALLARKRAVFCLELGERAVPLIDPSLIDGLTGPIAFHLPTLAFEPEADAWSLMLDAPPIDLHRLAAQPWRSDPLKTAFPGAILLSTQYPEGFADINICLLNLGVAARELTGTPHDGGAFAFDAGPCWVFLHSSRSVCFVRKDGQALHRPNIGYPQDQEASWTPQELDAASSACWRMVLATALMLSVDIDANALMSQARAEILAAEEKASLSKHVEVSARVMPKARSAL